MLKLIFTIISAGKQVAASLVPALLVLSVAMPMGACGAAPARVAAAAQPPGIEPDYQGLVIPPNIAPLNFVIKESAPAYYVRLSGQAGAPIELETRSPKVMLPEGAWRELLRQNKGLELRLEILARTEGNSWKRFLALTNHVAAEAIDPVLIYRKIHAAHNTWSRMGLYQRNLESFEERPFLENRRFAGDCCHCHSVRNNNPDTFTVLIRSPHFDNSLLVVSNGIPEDLRGLAGFTAWHPKGPVLAAAFSKPRLMLHTARNDMRDITELEGWIGYFFLGSNTVRRVPGLEDSSRLLAFPFWSPDGKYLYYCSAPNPWTNMSAATATSHTVAKYDLMRVRYDLERDRWGNPELILAARDTGFSIAQPRISPDGRWVFFCGIPYGCWPAYDAASDLYGLDLPAGEKEGKFTWRKLELNSAACESWLSWSANSRWVVFSSKRLAPLYNRPFISYVSDTGECSKPFVLPQRDPEFYNSLITTYTIPTLVSGPITVPQAKLVEALRAADRASLVVP